MLGDELLACLLVPRDDAGDGRRIVDRAADADAERVAHAEPLPPRRVVDLDSRRPDGEDDALLPRPREVVDLRPSDLPEEDPLERGQLLAIASLVEVEDDAPGRAGLVVAVARGDRDVEPREVGPVEVAILDQPRQRAEAEAVRRPARPGAR